MVDHPKRDLGGAVMLAHALTCHGIEAALIPLYDQAIDVPLLDLDGLVVNFAREVNLPLVRAYRALGIPVWVLDTEGGVLAESGGNAPDALACYIRESGYADLLSGYFFWGSVLRDAFVEGSGMAADRLHLTGCPRFDFAAPRWRDLLRYERSGYILFNANFSLVNPRFARSPEEEVGALTANGWEECYVRALIADMKQVLADFLAVVKNVALEDVTRTILVRPHPFENDQLYREHFEDLENVVVDGSGSVLDVIASSTAVVHLNCGTAIEAILLGRVPLSMEFLNRERTREHAKLPSRVSRPVHTEAELLAALRGLDAETANFEFAARHREHIAPWFHLNDGRAADRVALVIAERVTARPAGGRVGRTILSARNLRGSPSAGQIAQGLIASMLGSRTASRLRARLQPQRRDKRFGAANVEPIAAALSRGGKGLRVTHVRHPLTGASLSTVLVRPAT